MTAAPIYGVFLSSRLSPVSLEGVIAFRGLTGRALPSVVAAGWFLCLAVWAIQVFPHAGASFAGLAHLGCVIFFVLVFVTNSLARPKFLIPVIMHNTPGTLESHLAARARRMGRPTRGRPIDVPDLVTVIVDRKRDAGWHGCHGSAGSGTGCQHVGEARPFRSG